MAGVDDWSEEAAYTVLPPEGHRDPGRPKKQRKRDEYEKEISKKKWLCTKCGNYGHYQRSCGGKVKKKVTKNNGKKNERDPVSHPERRHPIRKMKTRGEGGTSETEEVRHAKWRADSSQAPEAHRETSSAPELLNSPTRNTRSRFRQESQTQSTQPKPQADSTRARKSSQASNAHRETSNAPGLSNSLAKHTRSRFKQESQSQSTQPKPHANSPLTKNTRSSASQPTFRDKALTNMARQFGQRRKKLIIRRPRGS